MKLFIYERFWDAFLKLNKTTQIKVTDFMNKFRADSRSAAINLESISYFKDRSLRTARIDQKYRAIIKEVVPSGLYLLIWVDNHDEAMEWAKNKVIDWNEQTQAYQVCFLHLKTVPLFQLKTIPLLCKVNTNFSLFKERCFYFAGKLPGKVKVGLRGPFNTLTIRYINCLTISLFLWHDMTFHSY